MELLPLGDSGDTFTIPSGATITNAGTATGFGATGAVSWDTSSIKTAGFTATAGIGYFCNTTGGIFTVALPAGSAGDVVGIADYAQTFQTNTLTVSPDGSEKIGGTASNALMSTKGVAATLVYVDSTQGWTVTDSGSSSDVPGPEYIVATGGTPCSGAIVCTNYKVHSFTGPGTFCVSSAGNPGGSSTVDYLVVAGGAGGGVDGGGGGGAGGYRESPGTASGCYTVSPLGAAPAVALPVSVQGYPITIGAAGAATPGASCKGGSGGDSTFSDITSTGGGGGGSNCTTPGAAGGSGGGARTSAGASGGAGNTPPFNPAQGTPGGSSSGPTYRGSGGGGATVAGQGNAAGGAGGTGATTHITASPVAYAGGAGGGGNSPCGGGAASPCGTGGQGQGTGTPGSAGTTNKGGGGGGGSGTPFAGGSGVVVIRYKFQ